MSKLLIRNGLVVTAKDERVADILVDDQTITGVGTTISADVDRIIDAQGKYVIPGGVDPHTHMEMPFGNTTTCDDFYSGTVAAAFGGTTTIVDFCLQQPGETFQQAIATWHEKLERCPPVGDVGFHLAITDLAGGGGADAVEGLAAEGITSIKLFMAYKDALMVDDETLFRAMEIAGQAGTLVMVHAESGDIIEVLIGEALAAGNTCPIWHARTRPPETEADATNRAIQFAHIAGCSLFVVHVSCIPALEAVERGQDAGWDVLAETCTQYLFVEESALDAPGFDGAKYVFTPPPRQRADQEALWLALANGTLSLLSSDHCPFRWSDQKALGRDDFSKIPNGGPTIEHRLHMLHHHGVRERGMSLSRLVELFATEPARIFGMYPKKGTIEVGSDADLVIFDPEREVTIRASEHHSRVDYNVFEGRTIQGAPETVILRGQPVIENGELIAAAPRGSFLHRGASAPIQEKTG